VSAALAGAAHAVPSAPRRASAVMTIARKEVQELLRDARLAWCASLLLILLATAALLGWQQWQRIDAERTAGQDVSYQQWLGQGSKNPHSAAHFGQYAFKPASPLAFVDPGISTFVGTTVWMEAHKQNEFKFRPARDATALQRFGQLSIAFVLQTLAPLFIILLTFSGFSSERERGTLRQIASVGIAPVQMLAGKALAIASVFALFALPLAIAAAASIPFLADHDHGAATLLFRAFMIGVSYVVYLGGFVALSLGVSAAFASSRQALVFLLTFWVLNSFVVPRVMTDVARTIAPTPTAAQFQATLTEARKASSGHDPAHPAVARLREQMLLKYKVASVEQLPFDFDGLVLREDDRFGYRVFDHHYGRLWASYQRQERLRSLAGWLFPLAAVGPVSMALAGTDTAQHNDFARQAEAYRRRIQDAMSADAMKNRRYGDKNYVAGPALWASIPGFDYQMPGAASVAAAQWPNFLMLLLWAAGASLFALAATRRLTPA
jgi:ABC-2 type transport system permease protein